MRKILFLLVILFNISMLEAQNQKVYIAVAMTHDSSIDYNTQSILKNKMLRLLSRNTIAATELGATILVPEISILDKELIEGGMRKITSLELGVTMTIRNMITNTVFHTMELSVKGEGYSESEAKRTAINKIDVNSPTCLKFVETAANRISDYYKANVKSLIRKAQTLAARQQYDEALALLGTFPESLDGYEQVAKAIKSVFKAYQTQNCSQILLAAQAAYAEGNLEGAAALASVIDAQSSCASGAKTLLSSVKRELNKLHQEEMKFQEKVLEAQKEEMKSRERKFNTLVGAAKEVAVSYFKRQNNYIFIGS